jgi:lipoprotein NlpD
MNRRFRGITQLGISALALVGCAANQPAPIVDWSSPASSPAPAPVASASAVDTYRVMRGDTLYAIAFKHGLDYRDLAAWNGIAAPYTIFAGRELRLSAPAHASPPAAPVVASAVAPATELPEPAPGAAVTAGIAEHPAAAPVSAFEDVPAPSAPAAPVTKPAEDVAPASPPAPAMVPKPAVAEATPPKPAMEPPVPKPPIEPPATKPASPPRSDSVPELSSGGVTWRWPSEGKVIAAYVSGEPTRQGIDIGGKAGDAVRAAADGEVVYSGNGLIGYGELIIVKHNANFLSAYGHNRSRLVKEGEKVKAGQAIAEMGASAGSRDELHFEIRKNGKPVNPLEYLPAR